MVWYISRLVLATVLGLKVLKAGERQTASWCAIEDGQHILIFEQERLQLRRTAFGRSRGVPFNQSN